MSTVLKDGNVVSEGRQLIDRYLRSEQELQFAKDRENTASCEFMNATNALGKWLLPKDAKDGEVFCVWHEGHLLQITKVDLHTSKLVVRERAKP